MRASRIYFGLLATLALASPPAPAGAQPVGEEFQINTYTTSSQKDPSVAADASGNFVVVWRSSGGDGSSLSILGQRYDSSGGTLGSEFRVNSYTTGTQDAPSVASAASGDFVVVWQSDQEGSDWGIFGQRYESTGMPLEREFQVNSYTTWEQLNAAVASDASGNFVVVWQSRFQTAIFGQRYDSAGMARGNEFRVNSYLMSSQRRPAVASDANGNFVVVWQSKGQDGSDFGIFGQRYDSLGIRRGAEFRVNSYTTEDQVDPAVASDADGNFVVVWESEGQDEDPGPFDGAGVFGQRYDSEGEALGREFQVNSFTTSYQQRPSVASDATGNFVVVWESYDQDGDVSAGIFGQRYDSRGVAQGDEFQVNSYTPSYQRYPSVVATGINQFVVAWESSGQDGSSTGIFGQRYGFAGDTIKVENPNTNVNWRIGSLQRIQWTHSLGLGAMFRIELDRDDNGEYEELIADDVAVDSATRGSYPWAVTGPPSIAARVRVSWTQDLSVSDSSDVTFQIRPAN